MMPYQYKVRVRFSNFTSCNFKVIYTLKVKYECMYDIIIHFCYNYLYTNQDSLSFKPLYTVEK